MNTHRAAASALAALIMLTSCSGNGTPSGAGSPGTPDQSPLSEYLGVNVSIEGGGIRIAAAGDEQPTEEKLAKRRQVEDAIASCMRDLGFRYLPVPPGANPKDKFNDAFRLPPGQFAEQYGYGISTLDFSEAGTADPNTSIRDALRARGQAAYDKALNGEQREPNGTGSGAKASDNRPGGCRAKALDQVYGAGTAAGKADARAQQMRRFDSLFTDLDALVKRIQGDPRVVAAARTWSDCMATARQSGLARPDDARDKVAQRFDRLLGIRPGHKKDISVGPDSLKNLDPTKLAAVRRYELAMAKADYDCRQQGYDSAYKEVQYAAEREFIKDHKTLLEQFKDAASQGER